jgi:hypothetical protein
MNDDLMQHLVGFVYKAGRTRTVEPHDYGIRRGVERLLGVQTGGESENGALHGWREFDVDQIRHLRILERRFPSTRPKARSIIARGMEEYEERTSVGFHLERLSKRVGEVLPRELAIAAQQVEHNE